MNTATDYVMDGTAAERERLVAQASTQATEARWLLERLGIADGARVVDVGCGPIGILDLLAERVGQNGEVVGIEREQRFAEMARQVVLERGLMNVQVVEGKATASGLPADSFDVVHARLVLMHQRDPRALLSEMVRLARPGGCVALQEIDAVSYVCDPPHPAWTRLWEATLAVSREFGIDVHIGRRLPAVLRSVGLANIDADAHTRLVPPGEYGRTHLVSLATGMRASILQVGLLTESELAEDLRAVQQHVADPETVILRETLVQAWGSKPR